MSNNVAGNTGQTLVPQDNLVGLIIQLTWFGFFVVYMFYGQRLQVKIMLKEIENSLFRLKLIRDRGRQIAISTIKQIGETDDNLAARVDRILDHVFITPVDIDPSGIIQRLEHVLDVRDFRLKDEVRLMVPEADEIQINNLANMLEAALVLNQIYKIVRHYYLTGKKTSSFYVILQLQMILPQIMKESQAFANALTAFKAGQPIGDGIGAFVAAKLMHGKEGREIARDVIVSEVPIEGRTAYVLKAKGPGGNVGKPGEAVKQLLEEKEGKIARILVIDAAQKLEGEKPGEIVEGTGVAIGGPGVEKYKVEEIATKYKVPLNAILIKEGIGDVVSTMRKEISDSVEEVLQRIRRIIRENTKEGDCVIIAGIGNTMGIGQ
ncbi:hypothetical protein B6U79_02320 [Candidatus Bathyarchaeota archaeon ex4484_231]|nr:MAG: hypothetical protein B6U79_02320 [Candidatus Bathyarchaeota archaeon ex4484_231]RJS76306.1 MAG: DUF1512 domain-containing protein [Candidatus Bathyarchaeota archaeon]